MALSWNPSRHSQRVLEDATFGLKNKNKSAKVQKYVKQVEVAVKHSDGTTERLANAELRKANKALRAAQDEELRALLGEGLVGNAASKKKGAELSEKAMALGLTAMSKEVEELLAEFSSSSSEEEEIREKRQTIYLDSEDSDVGEGVVMHKEKTIEDLIDDQRAKLASLGQKGTPVTEETFAVWRKAKLEQKQKDAEARVKLEQTKRKGGKGLSVLSGRELFKYDKSLFTDDADALNQEQEMELSNAQKLTKLAEEELERQAYEKAQKDQERLMLAEQLEREARKNIDTERRREAKLNKEKQQELMMIGGIVINKVVFIEAEWEDLTPFEEDVTDEEDNDEEEEEEPEPESVGDA